ncbi:putative bifunctional diguanylate cyclase/phosphodiesterase [Solimicrobium silvestre]|uniref:GGDEF: diguanylate cyclase (GGDEF) domain n=1 Tax=Solimicrobium silvestre TaxID=2099400 RepID=A0A2S9GWG6_9BURK|nr:GGDEF domain-containing phosphodiesterase [Solimicrobium silvestre]PRC92063.1 GGDEF: diguanylate cyclase (GGDEF) domain [Solimicrobium silvestre]
MSIASQARHIFHILVDVFAFKIEDKIAIEKRIRNVTAVATIGLFFGFVFALFNLFTPNMALLGLIELGSVIFLMGPATILGRNPDFVGFAEALVLLAMLCIVMGLIAFGGVEGTGLFWVYTAPFLAFFLKGQHLGWRYSLVLLGIVTAYFIGTSQLQHVFYRHSPVVSAQFIISLVFYILIAAAFNQLRSRFEEQLQKQVVIKTADAQKLLDQLQLLASRDSLTKLPNKVTLVDILKQQIDETSNPDSVLVVCILRLERMLEMSNILGIAKADQLILKVVEYLARFTEAKGTLAHTHRDEFVVTYPTDRASFNDEGLERFIAERQISVEIQGYVIYCEFTLGLAIYPDHAKDPQLLLDKAQQAMLQAHKNGNQWSIYDSKQEQAFVRHHLLFGKLRAALMQQHLRVHYQPQIDLVTGLIVGAEALLRWQDPVEGYISPLEFIPVAEESGLIRPLTTWLVDVCVRECSEWRKQGFELHVSINLSALNLLDPELINVLMTALKKYNLAAFNITLEITESCFMSSPERALEVIQRLHETGFRLAIDDFGTGYSSLSYLKNLPIHELKIDQSFVRKLLQNKGDQAIVSSTVDLAHNFGLVVVAEGIEDEPTSHWLHTRGCDIGQGYFFAKPMPSDAFLKLLFTNLLDHKPEKEINEDYPTQ